MIKALCYVVGMYLVVLVVLVSFFIAVLLIADSSNFPTPWIEGAVASLFDLLKVTIGATVGSISAAGAVIFNENKSNK